MAAPIVGPVAEASATVSAVQPIARPRRRCGTVWRTMAAIRDITQAEPSPCRKRAPTSTGRLGDSAQSTEAAVNSATPAVKTGR